MHPPKPRVLIIVDAKASTATNEFRIHHYRTCQSRLFLALMRHFCVGLQQYLRNTRNCRRKIPERLISGAPRAPWATVISTTTYRRNTRPLKAPVSRAQARPQMQLVCLVYFSHELLSPNMRRDRPGSACVALGKGTEGEREDGRRETGLTSCG